jgi:hypothetical protein
MVDNWYQLACHLRNHPRSNAVNYTRWDLQCIAGGVTGADGLVLLLGGLFSVVRRSRDDLLLDIIN